MAKKILKRSLALGALMAFVITGSAMAADEKISVESGKKVYSSSVDINSDVTSVRVKASAEGTQLDLTGEYISTNGNGKADSRGVNAFNSTIVNVSGTAVVNLGSDSTKSINIVNEDYGLLVQYNGAAINVKGKELNITSNTGNSAGIWAMNGNLIDNNPSDNARLTIDKNTSTTIKMLDANGNPGGYGIWSTSMGIVDIKGDLYVEATQAIASRGKSTIKINSDGDVSKNIQINGDIVYSLDPQDIHTISSNIDIKFMNSNSYFNGSIYQDYNEKKAGPAKATNLLFENGATWKLTNKSIVTNAVFGKNSVLEIEGNKHLNSDNYAITGMVKVDPTATLKINGLEQDKTYYVVKGEEKNYAEDGKTVFTKDLKIDSNFSDANLSYDRINLVSVEETKDGYVYEVTFKAIDDNLLQMAQEKTVAATGGDALAAPGIIKGAIGSGAPAGAKDLVSAITSSGASIDQKAAMVNAVAKIGEAGGTTANAASVVNNVTGITTQRMSFTNVSTTPQGGHGKVERKYKSGAGVWAQYMHGKDKVEDMPSAGGANSYDSQYNGAVIGYDFKEVGKTHTGISFNYGEGDSHSKDSIVSTRNDFDFWGIGLYHSIMNEDTNLIFDVNYNKTDADVTQIVPCYGKVTVSPNTTAISAGVRAEKLIQNGPVQIVPYVGARFLSIDTDEYTSSAGIKYSPDRQNVWLVPVGVSLRQENTYENGWKVTPKADLSYIWALGDTDTSMNVVTDVKVDNLAYTVMDNGSFLGTLGIEAEKGDWTYGLSYSYQKGEYQRSDKWFVDVRYSF